MKPLDPASRELFALLHDYRLGGPARRAALVETVLERFGAERTILIGDMAGFTRGVLTEGIVHYLSLIAAVRELCAPLVEASGGYLFKSEADNIFAAFVDPGRAIEAAVRMQRRLREVNAGCPNCDRLDLGLGLARGRVLAVGSEDAWGAAVNFASKLGEDLSGAGQILAHESLQESLEERGLPLEEREDDLSGFRLRYFRVAWT